MHRRLRLSSPFRGFYRAYSATYNEARARRKPLRHCDLYVVRLLPEPEGRQPPGSSQLDQSRFGLSRPCVRCLRALDAFGVHRVIFSTGEESSAGEVGCEVREVQELLATSCEAGHCSRGDKCSVAIGAVRRQECQ